MSFLERHPGVQRFTFYAAGYVVGYLWGRHVGASMVVARMGRRFSPEG